MKTKDIDLVKIVDEVLEENELHSGTYKVAALTAMQRLQDIYEKQANGADTEKSNCNIPFVITRLCPNCNHPNTKKESLNKYVCRYCESEPDTNW
jgi:hypothetical protein